jgi:predicted amidophosphoribosyltransferase
MEFDGALALGLHTSRLRELVLAMKHASRRELAHYFAERLAPMVRSLPFSLVTAVPITRFDFALNGYNPAAEVAEHVGRILGRPFDEQLLRKVRRTRKQKELPLPLRVRNPLDAFQVTSPARVQGQSILLVDDVITTGATLSACSVPLRRSGAVGVWAAAVTRG